MEFHYPGQEHLTPTPAPKPAPPATAPAAPKSPHGPDVQRRALSLELALKAAGPGNIDRVSKGSVDQLLHAAYSFERYLVTGVPAALDGTAPTPHGATAVKVDA